MAKTYVWHGDKHMERVVKVNIEVLRMSSPTTSIFLNNMEEFQQDMLWVTHRRGADSSAGCSCEDEKCASNYSSNFDKEKTERPVHKVSM